MTEPPERIWIEPTPGGRWLVWLDGQARGVEYVRADLPRAAADALDERHAQIGYDIALDWVQSLSGEGIEVDEIAALGKRIASALSTPRAETGLTVEAALAELRQTFGRHVEITVIDCNAPGCKAYRYQVEVQHLGLKTHGASVDEVMQQARAWAKSRRERERERT